MKRKVLGKGLEALLPDKIEKLSQAVVEISIDEIMPSKYQPRLKFERESLESLANSIKENGILQPLLLRRHDNNYQIIAGERRWKAARLAGLSTVPAIVRDVVDAEVLKLALIENLQREDLNPIEEALAYKTMVEEFHLTHEELAQRIGKDRSTITNALRLLKLPEEVKNLLSSGSLSMGHGRALAALENGQLQLQLARKIAKEGLPVRAIEQLLKKKKQHKPAATDPNVRSVEEKLQRTLSTKVKIMSRKNKGRIVIYFHSLEEFDRLFDHIMHL